MVHITCFFAYIGKCLTLLGIVICVHVCSSENRTDFTIGFPILYVKESNTYKWGIYMFPMGLILFINIFTSKSNGPQQQKKT